MSPPSAPRSRLRAYMEFLAAVFYFFLARGLAHHGADVLGAGQLSVLGSPLAEQTMLALFLLVGYAAMGFWLDREMYPISAQGLPRREGWPREAAMGLAAGWGVAVACVLPMLVAGGIAITITALLPAWTGLAAGVAFFAMAALAEEIAFRGYGFQRFAEVVGPVAASLVFAAYYALVQAMIPGSGRASIAVSAMLALVLSAAYLRTRALWLSWGLNFGWKASRALLFGLAVSGDGSHSSVVQSDPMGPFWLTGGGFGLDGTWVAFFVMLAALPLVFRITRDLDFKYNAPVIVPGGIPVDLDAAARAQHEAAMGAQAPTAPALVQIGPVVTPAPASLLGAKKEPEDSSC
ncbi:MAG: CPBP family intramembrane glutamic endopeptidase [Terracidiphilus sp.]